MKHGSNPRRARSRGNGKRHPSPRGGQSIESNGPEVKVRGTAQQVQEKYLALARDAFSSGDRIAAEGYFQFAEHYHRMYRADHGGGGHNDRRPHRVPSAPQPDLVFRRSIPPPRRRPPRRARPSAPAVSPAAKSTESADPAEATKPTEPATP